MKNRFLICISAFCMCFILVGCGNNNTNINNNNEINDNSKTNVKEDLNKKEEEYNHNTIIDDEIIDFDEEDNYIEEDETITSTLINCNDCVFAIYTDNKTFGDTLIDYTTDYNTLKDRKGKQLRRFMGHVIDSNGTILKAYTCGIKNGKAFCLQGATDDSTYQYNIGILNQVFDASECRYIANGLTYTCTDGNMNGDTRADGYVSVHYDDSCYVFGDKAKFGCYSK